MRKESISANDFEELKLNFDVGGSTDAVGMVTHGAISSILGAAEIWNISKRDYLSAAVTPFAYLVGIYPEIKKVSVWSDKRAEVLRDLIDPQKLPDEEFGITKEEYKGLKLEKSRFFKTETQKMIAYNALASISGYHMLDGIVNHDWKRAVVASGIFAFCQLQNILIGVYSDRRREVLKKILGSPVKIP